MRKRKQSCVSSAHATRSSRWYRRFFHRHSAPKNRVPAVRSRRKRHSVAFARDRQTEPHLEITEPHLEKRRGKRSAKVSITQRKRICKRKKKISRERRGQPVAGDLTRRRRAGNGGQIGGRRVARKANNNGIYTIYPPLPLCGKAKPAKFVILSGAKDPCEGTEQSDPYPDCRKRHCRYAAEAVPAKNVTTCPIAPSKDGTKILRFTQDDALTRWRAKILRFAQDDRSAMRRKLHCRLAAGALRAECIVCASSTAHARSSGRRSPFPLGGRHPVAGTAERSRGKAQSRTIAATRQGRTGKKCYCLSDRAAWETAPQTDRKKERKVFQRGSRGRLFSKKSPPC